MTIWLVRHGESDANIGLATADPQSIALTKRGWQQAKQIASYFSSTYSPAERPMLIVTSPYLRTKQTAYPLFSRYPDLTEAEWPVQEFTYLSPLKYKDTAAHDRRAAAMDYWQQADPLWVDGPGAESFAGFMARVSQFQQKIADLSETTVVFSHEKFIQAVLWSLIAVMHQINSQMMKSFRAFSDSFALPNGALIPLNVWQERLYWGHLQLSHLNRAD